MVVQRWRACSAVVLGMCMWVTGCDSAPHDRTPTGALLRFVEAMDVAERDPEALERAYGLLHADAREALEARAHRAEALAGREMAPWEMLATGRFRLHVPVDGHEDWVERMDGDRAVVVIPGDDGTPRAEVPMIREDDRWRVQLPIPPVARP